MREIVTTSLLFSSLLYLTMAILAWIRRNIPPAQPLLALVLLCAVVAFTYSMDLISATIESKMFWMQFRFSAAVIMSFITFCLVTSLTHNNDKNRKPTLMALFMFMVITLIVIWSNQSHYLFRYGFEINRIGDFEILRWENGPFYWLSVGYIQILLGISLFILVQTSQKNRSLLTLQSILLFIAVIIPLLTDLLFNLGYSLIPGFNFAPHSMVLSIGILFYAFFRYRWLGIVPLARSSLVDLIPVGVIVLNANRQILDINPAARHQFGLSEDIVGKYLDDVLAHLLPGIKSQIDFSKKHQQIQMRLENGKVKFLELSLLALKGNFDHFDGTLVMIQDITDRKNKEMRLLQLTQGIEQSPTSVVITSLNGQIEYVNPIFTQLTGYTPEEAIGRNANIVSSGLTSKDIYNEMWQTIVSGQPWQGEFLNRKKNGELYWEKAVIAPIKDLSGKVVNYIAIKEDITDQKAAEEALRRSESELRFANTELEQRLRKIEALEAELREQAIRDPLTGLFNRRYFNESIEREIARSQRAGEPLSIILVDVDHFKEINDTYGHQVGDAFLVIVANRLQNNSRRSDIITRYGGEEFLLVLPNISIQVAARRADELRQSIANASLAHLGVEIRTTISGGVACFPLAGTTAVELLRAADEALYVSKNLGRNRITVWKKNNHPKES
jgi:diguanylate cyclase (GGDEF)-like protein/PAS domain S-box-containing protein